MAVRQHTAPFPRLSVDDLAKWKGAEAAAVSDCLDRGYALDGGIKPLDRSMRLVGQARTVHCMAADNSALHAAINMIEPGDILIADAGGYLGNAVWGGQMTEAAVLKHIGGLVIDGAVRDSDEIIQHGFPCFARGTVPAGPHKNFGGEIDGPIACGGVAVRAGDLVIGDADGVTIVPIERADRVYTAYQALKAKEARALAALAQGGTLAEIYGVPDVIPLED
ncbi:MAG: RraA family protein [Pseudomonadota bacterium]